MTLKLKCKSCKKIICEAEDLESIKKILNEKWIQCPYCNKQFENPYYEK